MNGVPRVVEVAVSKKAGDGGGSVAAGQERADPLVLGSIGAPMAGSVIEVSAKPGAPPQRQVGPPVACQKGQGAALLGVHAGRSRMIAPPFFAQRRRERGVMTFVERRTVDSHAEAPRHDDPLCI